MKYTLLSLLPKPLLRTINYIIPKKKNQILFVSIPDFSDNPKAFFDYISGREEYEIIWIAKDPKNIKSDIKVYKDGSIHGIYQFVRSKYIISSHNYFWELKAKNQFYLNLWHGMPLKGIFFTENGISEKYLKFIKRCVSGNFFMTATSTITRNALVSCFNIDPRKIKIVGQPRNDKLYRFNGYEILNKLLKIEISKYEHIVLFLPTYRIRKNHCKIEGTIIDKNIFDFEDFDKKEFEKFLEKNKILFLLKIHPFEEEQFSNFNCRKNIQLLNSTELTNANIDLYELLGSVDVLITDYSSVAFDFLLLNRPLIFTPTDLDEYTDKRGFVLEPYDFWTPGPKVLNYKSLQEELKKCIENPKYFQSERDTINLLINHFKDDKSCQRVLKLIKDFEKKS